MEIRAPLVDKDHVRGDYATSCIYDRESNLRICDRDEVRGVAASVCSAIASGYAAEGDCG